ncbi:rhodanese-like domain-containing protein [Flavihumibacter petaseus]|uniref:Rhodanese domain-containing protein n=1 Tax=Flavihumibacter petaseus NBRC 106054 TaxID=1220578 RepID=A0A0E9N553_9BACT|nr:rhodanese-like domain-containing protein [Flavihumibacter petaseus]GAO44923.1 hypothetical protein FPE01S_04_01660 [Flavihumibacter petaseus NBRC 106054]
MIRQIDHNALSDLQAADPSLKLIDVREDFEHEAFNIGGDNIPLNEILQAGKDFPKDTPVVLYCRKGIRSAIAIQRLHDRYGFTNLLNLEGGLDKKP